MAHAMPATRDTSVSRMLLIAVIVVALLLGVVALGVWLWPTSEEAATVRNDTPKSLIQSATAAEHGVVGVAPQSVIQSATAAEHGVVGVAPPPLIQSATAAEHGAASP